MNSPADDIKDMLVADTTLGLTFATNLFVGTEPAKPDNCATIFDTPGFAPQLTLTKGENYYYPSIQIRVRNRDYRTGWALIQDIMVSLHGRSQETWNGTLYSVIYCSSGPAQLDWDNNGNCRHICNFNIQCR